MSALEIDEEFIQMNPDAILEFLSGKKEYINYLNQLYEFITVYFPDSDKYLKYDEHPESYELDSLIIYVVNRENTPDENNAILDLLESDLLGFESKFPEITKRAIIFARSDDEYCRRAMKCYAKNGCF